MLYLRKEEKYQRNTLTLRLKELEKEEQTKPKFGRRKEVMMMRAKINDIETKKQQKRPMKLKFNYLKR